MNTATISGTISETDVEVMAKRLAASAGQVWDHLNSYPGFERGRWRSEARRFLQRQIEEDRRQLN